jgi:YD repeat-containing protein
MKKNFLMIMSLLTASVSYAQRIVKIEYDASGNVVKQHSPQKAENASLDDQYSIKVYPNPTAGPVRIKVYEGRSGNYVSCEVQIMVYNAAGYASPVINKTFTNGDIQIDLSSSPNGTYVLYAIVFLDPQHPLTNSCIKIVKQS